ncbi:MAG: ComEC/Rec2 family competence protein, partial [Pollutimonas bauzanensis]
MTGRICLLAFVAATGAAHGLPYLPDHVVWAGALALAVLASIAVFSLAGRHRWHVLLPLWAGIAGLLVAVARAEHRLADSLDSANENRVSRVVLRVAALPRLDPDSRQFEAEVISSMPAGVPSRIQVTWAAPDWAGPYGRAGRAPADGGYAGFAELAPGQVWRMSLTLKKPHGNRNPHAFDYESHLFAQGIRATGSVRGAPLLLRDEPWASLPVMAQRARHRVRAAMQPYLAGKRYGAVLLALAIGDQASVEASDWQVFNRTGITHLVSISGSHITMIAALGGSLAFWLWRRGRLRGRALAERLPAQVAAALAALLVAWLYCLLAGWGVPARRTFLMLAVVAAAYLLRLPMDASRLLPLAAFAVVLLDPWALLASGFWLSFGAVCVLMASAGWWGRSS